MADVEIVIKIPEEKYDVIKSDLYNTFPAEMKEWGLEAIRNGTPLHKGHGRLKDVDKFLEKVKKDREHEIYMHSWTADMVLKRLDSWYASTIIEADREEQK